MPTYKWLYEVTGLIIQIASFVFLSLNTYYFQPYFFFNHLLYSKMWLKLGLISIHFVFIFHISFLWVLFILFWFFIWVFCGFYSLCFDFLYEFSVSSIQFVLIFYTSSIHFVLIFYMSFLWVLFILFWVFCEFYSHRKLI
jgi:small-conductance mechanosensitive channel